MTVSRMGGDHPDVTIEADDMQALVINGCTEPKLIVTGGVMLSAVGAGPFGGDFTQAVAPFDAVSNEALQTSTVASIPGLQLHAGDSVDSSLFLAS